MPTEPTSTEHSCQLMLPLVFRTETVPNSSPLSGKSLWDHLHSQLAVRLALQQVEHNRHLRSLARSFLGDLRDPPLARRSLLPQACLSAPGLDPKFWEPTKPVVLTL